MINFKMSEFIKSKTAEKYKINNMPNLKELDNLLNLIIYCMQPIRILINKPIIITSGFRCNNLNKLVKGKPNSQHIKGCACDFQIKRLKPNNIIKIIEKSNIEYDQLICEYNSWVHISYVKNKNRKQILYY